MKVSIIGNGLTSLTLAKALVNLGINVDIFSNKKIKNYSKIQTIGISKSNVDFFNRNIMDIKKLLWNIKKIDIFSENLYQQKILNFENENNTLFSVVKNFDLQNRLFLTLSNNKLISFKKDINFENLKKKNYKLIFNCDPQHSISRKFFFSRK